MSSFFSLRPYVIAILICISASCNISYVSALSVPSQGVNGFASSTTAPKRLKASDLNKQQQQRRKKSYTPDGLTEEQYAQIRNEELAKQQSMNYGAWGPRFKLVNGDPEFWNWFSSPTLWTGGFNGNNNNVSDNNKKIGMQKLLVIYLRRYALAYMMMLLSVQVLTNSKALPIKKVWSANSRWVYTAMKLILPVATLKPISMLSALAERRQLRWMNNTTKLAAIIAALMTAVSLFLR